MRRGSMMLVAVVLAAGCGQGAAAGSGPGAGSPSAGPPAATAAELQAAANGLLAAYNRRDASAVCADFAPDVVAWTERGVPPVIPPGSCERWVGQVFQPLTDDSGEQSPAFQSIKLVRWYPPFTAGPTREITAELRVVFPGGSSPAEQPQWVDFYYVRVGGRLLLAKQPPMNIVLRGPGNTQLIDDLPPSTPQSVLRPVHLKSPTFSCSGPPASSSDPSDDVRQILTQPATPVAAPWLDIRQVTGYGLATAHPCLAVSLAAPARAPLHLLVSGGSNAPVGPELVVGPDMFYEYSGLNAHVAHPVGERGSTLYLALDPSYSPWSLTGMSVCVSAPLFQEPALNQTSDPQDGWASTGQPSCSVD